MITADAARKIAQESVNESSMIAILANITQAVEHAASKGQFFINIHEELKKLTPAERDAVKIDLVGAGFRITPTMSFTHLEWR